MSGPTFQALGTAVNVSGTGTLLVGWPTHQADDIAILICENNGNPISFSDAQGFVEITGSPLSPDSTSSTSYYWCRATSSSMTGPTFADEASGNHKIAQIITFRGCTTTGNPWDVISTGTATTSTSVSIPGATTTVVDTLVVAMVSWATDTATAQASAWANADLGSVAEIDDVGTSTGNGGGFSVATGTKAVAGAYGATTATLANTSVQSLMTIALKPPGAGGAPGRILLNESPFSSPIITAGG